MLINIEINEDDLKDLVKQKLEQLLDKNIDEKDIKFYVKSKQNYKSEWETANFKAEYNSNK